MSLSAKYLAFLANPTSSALADKSSIHYITTLTSINDAPAIIKHLAIQEKLLKKKSEKVLGVIESANGLSLDVEITIEFISGGGAYLPGLDDNFVADRIVTFPMVHIVHFNDEQKIEQIRLYWDQGSLLKQIDVIGARARNWPIRDGKDQARLIAMSSKSATGYSAVSQLAQSRRSTTSKGQDDVTITEHPVSTRTSRSSTTNAMNDPHASLDLFQPRDINQDLESSYIRPAAPRAQSAKPPARELSELFVGENPPSPSPGKSASPQKERIPNKSGGGKNFKPNRLFDEEDVAAATPLSVKTNSKKYNHFEFGDNDDDATPKGQDMAGTSLKSKHASQWDFDDFVTPAKTREKVLPQAVRHFGWSDDEDETSPVRRPIVHKARPDADPQFEFADDGLPEGERKRVTSKGRLHNKGLGLYQDHVYQTGSDEENDGFKGDVKRPLGDVTTAVKNENRKKDFGSQWEMKDKDSPKPALNSQGNGKMLKAFDNNWDHYEHSPEQGKKENVDITARGIKTAGNGMGGRKGTGRGWAIGDSDDDYAADSAPAAGTKAHTNARRTESKGFWDF